MSPKAKKGLVLSGVIIDIAITIFLFILSIILLVKVPENKATVDPTTFLGWFYSNATRILLVCVIPLVLLLGLNIFFLVLYVRKTGKRKVNLKDLSEEDKEALRKKIMEELSEKKEEK